ncbi:MAG: ParA family protein [Anaerolineae bacterium]|jgi:chromosome partitioning protein
MSKIIGVLNYKGGTGKTTTVVSLAAGLARRGKRVLCVDLDAQGAVATYLDVDYPFSLSHLLLGQVELPACIVRARNDLDLIASDRSLARVERQLWRMDDRWKATRKLADKMCELEGYDYVFLDFSPSAGIVGECGLQCAQELIVPVAMDYLALVGARQVIETLEIAAEAPLNPLELSMIVPTFYREQLRKDREILDMLERYFGGKVTQPVRRDVKLSEAPSFGMSIFEYAPQSAGAADYMRLVERIASDG